MGQEREGVDRGKWQTGTFTDNAGRKVCVKRQRMEEEVLAKLCEREG